MTDRDEDVVRDSSPDDRVSPAGVGDSVSHATGASLYCIRPSTENRR